MPLTSENLATYAAFWETIDAAVDCIPNPPPPSAVARVKGTMKNVLAQMKAMLGQLETRDPATKDEADLRWIDRTLSDLLEDKWVIDGWAKIEIDWHGAKAAETAGITIAPTPLTLQGAVGMLQQGLVTLRA
jgi:hypothetical protein